MARAGCAATTCAPPPRSSAVSPSRWQNHRSAPRTYRSFTLRACRRQGRRITFTPQIDFLIDAAAIRNARNSPANNIITFSNRRKFAPLRAHFALLTSLLTNRVSPLPRFLIASAPGLEFHVTHSQETRKLFLIASFSALFSASCLVKQSVFHVRPSLERRASVTVLGCHESQVTNHKSRITGHENPERRMNPKRVP